MPTNLITALRRKFKTPKDALSALGLDTALLATDAFEEGKHPRDESGKFGSAAAEAKTKSEKAHFERHKESAAELEKHGFKHDKTQKFYEEGSHISKFVHTKDPRATADLMSVKKQPPSWTLNYGPPGGGAGGVSNGGRTAKSLKTALERGEPHKLADPNRKERWPRGRNTQMTHDSALAGDSKESKMPKMSLRGAVAKGALLTYLRPRLAEDTKIELSGYLAGVTAKNLAARVPVIAERLRARYTPALAADADLDDVEEVLAAVAELSPEIAEMTEGGNEETDDMPPEDMEEDDDPPEMMAKVREFLKDCLTPEEMAKFDEMVGGTPEVKEPEEVVEDEATKEEKMPVTKAAMDAAIQTAVAATTARQVAIRDAEKAVRPYVGELSVAFDSADAVYRTALEMLGVPKVKDIHPSAYSTILGMQKTRGQNQPAPRLATDAATKSLNDFLPGAGSIQRM